jgi:uncharacterized protein YndB with AHSA1/START domain
MADKFTNNLSIFIDAPVAKVWRSLIDPALIKQYFFGVDSIGEWTEGNTVISKGKWQGKKFEGKAKVLQVEFEKRLRHTYWSSLSGLPDVPENHHVITYELSAEKGGTTLTLTEENLPTYEMKEQSAKLWNVILDNMKKLTEKEK